MTQVKRSRTQGPGPTGPASLPEEPPGEDPAGGAVYGLLPGALVLIPAPGQREGEPVVSATQSVALSRPEHPTGVHTASRAGDRLHAKCSAHHLSRYLFVPGVLQGTEGQRRFIDFVTAARGRLPRTEGPSCSRGCLVSEPASPGRDCSVAQTHGGGGAWLSGVLSPSVLQNAVPSYWCPSRSFVIQD